MDIPDFAINTIQALTQAIPLKELELASSNLTQRYRQKSSGNHLQERHVIEAYLATRFPATYTVAAHVLTELNRLSEQGLTGSILDLGAGPGTASLAADQIFTDLKQIYLYEINREMITTGKHIFANGSERLKQAKWHYGTVLNRDLPDSELSIAAYVLNELTAEVRSQFIELLGLRKDRFLVFIEPGTPEGYQHLMQVRTLLQEKSWNVWAPCPHQEPCPLTNDWCHFAARLPRTALHRQLKGGSKGHEDEKFAYLILSREPAPVSAGKARIIRHPGIHKGHIRLNLCQTGGVNEQIVSKKDPSFKLARKINWGQQWQG